MASGDASTSVTASDVASSSASELASTSRDAQKRKAGDADVVPGMTQNGNASKKAKSADSNDEGQEDDEWALFQKEVLANVGKSGDQSSTTDTNSSAVGHPPEPLREDNVPRSTYVSATVEVAPQLRGSGHGREEGGDATTEESEETEAQKRRRLLREEKEEIISRLEAEQQQQDEADER